MTLKDGITRITVDITEDARKTQPMPKLLGSGSSVHNMILAFAISVPHSVFASRTPSVRQLAAMHQPVIGRILKATAMRTE